MLSTKLFIIHLPLIMQDIIYLVWFKDIQSGVRNMTTYVIVIKNNSK